MKACAIAFWPFTALVAVGEASRRAFVSSPAANFFLRPLNERLSLLAGEAWRRISDGCVI